MCRLCGSRTVGSRVKGFHFQLDFRSIQQTVKGSRFFPQESHGFRRVCLDMEIHLFPVRNVIAGLEGTTGTDQFKLAVRQLDHSRIKGHAVCRRETFKHNGFAFFHKLHLVSQFFGNERHKGMQKFQDAEQRIIQHHQSLLLFHAAGTELHLFGLDEPVAEIAPHQFINFMGGTVEAEFFQSSGNGCNGVIQLGQHPAFIRSQHQRGSQTAEVRSHRALQAAETAGVPQLVGKVPAQFALFIAVTDIHPHRGDIGNGETQSVRTILRDHIQRIGGVPQRFAQFAAQIVTDDTGEIHILERNIIHKLTPGHDHAGNPEEDDIRPGHQVAGGIELLQFRGLFRPAHDGERPEPAGEPGVQHVFFLPPFARSGGFFHPHIDFTGFVIIPRRDPVAPPDLPGNTPVLNVFHPVEIGLAPAFRIEFDLTGLHRFDGRLGKFLHIAEPLAGNQRFHRHVAAFGITDGMTDIFDLFHQPKFFHGLHRFRTGGKTVQTGKTFAAAGVHAGIRIHHIDDFQIMPLAHFKVVGVVSRSDLHTAGPLGGISVFIPHDGDLAICQRQLDHLADQVLVTGILRVHRHSRISEHGFRTGGSHDQVAGTIRQRITEVIEFPGFFLVDHFFVGQSTLGHRTPVDHTLTAVNVAFLVKFHKDLADRHAQAVIHGKAFAFPVRGTAQRAELTDNGAAVLLLPFPDPADEFIPAQIVTAGIFLVPQILVHPGFGSDTGVIRTGEPADFLAQHPVITDQNILKRIVQHMAQRQDPRHIRRRDDNGIGLLIGSRITVEIIAVFPDGIPLGFHLGRLISFDHIRCIRHGKKTPS